MPFVLSLTVVPASRLVVILSSIILTLLRFSPHIHLLCGLLDLVVSFLSLLLAPFRLLLFSDLAHQCLDLGHLHVVARNFVTAAHLELLDLYEWVLDHPSKSLALFHLAKVNRVFLLWLLKLVLTGIFLGSCSFIDRLAHQKLFGEVFVSLRDVLVHPVEALEARFRNHTLLDKLHLQVFVLFFFSQLFDALLLFLVVIIFFLLSRPDFFNVAELFWMPRLFV